MGVSEVVQTDAGESGAMHELLEGIGQELWVVWRSVVAGEQVRLVITGRACGAQHVDGAGVQTMVLPAARAGAISSAAIVSGQFQGVMIP